MGTDGGTAGEAGRGRRDDGLMHCSDPERNYAATCPPQNLDLGTDDPPKCA